MNSDSLSRARTLARILDSAVRIPGTDIRFGLDPLLGLVPGLGDVAGAGFASYLLIVAARLGVPRVVLARMLLNIGIDTVVGTVPVLGDVFDVGWKANTRNLALMERYLERPTATRATSRALIIGVTAGVVLIALAGLALTALLISMIIRALG